MDIELYIFLPEDQYRIGPDRQRREPRPVLPGAAVIFDNHRAQYFHVDVNGNVQVRASDFIYPIWGGPDFIRQYRKDKRLATDEELQQFKRAYIKAAL